MPKRRQGLLATMSNNPCSSIEEICVEKLRMFPIPWYVIFCISALETFLIIQTGFSLFNIKVGWRDSIIVAIGMGFVSCVLPRIPFIPGINTVLLIIFTGITITWLGKVEIMSSFISVMCGAVITGSIENFVTYAVLRLLAKNMSDLSVHPWLNFAVSMPTILLLTVILLLVRKYKWILYDLSGERKL